MNLFMYISINLRSIAIVSALGIVFKSDFQLPFNEKSFSFEIARDKLRPNKSTHRVTSHDKES